MPDFRAFILETVLPSGVRGPVDFCALRRLASICLKEDIELSAISRQLETRPTQRVQPTTVTGWRDSRRAVSGASDWKSWGDFLRMGSERRYTEFSFAALSAAPP